MKTIRVVGQGAGLVAAGFLGTVVMGRWFSPAAKPGAPMPKPASRVASVAAPMPGLLRPSASAPAAALAASAAPDVAPPAAPAAAGAADMAAGRLRFSLHCMACHGADALGNAVYGAPALAGQAADYLTRQLHKFRTGTRGAHPDDVQGQQMAAILRLYPDENSTRDLVSYLAGLPPFHLPATLAVDTAKGAAAFTTTCQACHGASAEGNPAMKAPRLAGQADWYLDRQIKKFKHGIRGADPSDLEGTQMAAMSKTLFDDDVLESVAAYINQLPGKAPAPSAASAPAPASAAEPAAPAVPAGASTSPAVAAASVAWSGMGAGHLQYALRCLPCHGADAQGNAAYGAPALAGQAADYLTRQLHKFRAGTRGAHPDDVQGHQMAAIVRLLPDEASSRELVQYLSALPPFHTQPSLHVDTAKGAVAFSTTCQACHGPKAEGNPVLKAPRLAGQADWYLERQITKFKHGVRGAEPTDSEGMQMAAMSKTLFDEEVIRSVAAYIQQLK